MTVWLLQCDKRATVCFCAWWCAFFASVVVCFMHRNAICLCALLCFPVIFYFFRVFLRRQCAACTHERKRNIVRSVSLYSGTYQLKGCCLDGLRWGYSVKKKKTSHSNVRALGEVFHHTSDYWKYHSWGLRRQHKPRTVVVFFYFHFYNSHTFLAALSS